MSHTVPSYRNSSPPRFKPNLLGWTYSGGAGELSGANAGRELFNLGVPVMVSRSGFPIDPQVFEEAAFKWDAYIRG